MLFKKISETNKIFFLRLGLKQCSLSTDMVEIRKASRPPKYFKAFSLYDESMSRSLWEPFKHPKIVIVNIKNILCTSV